MAIKIIPAKLSGDIRTVSSKSDAHRLMICAALSDKPTEIIIDGISDDIKATERCLNALGAGIEKTVSGYRVTPIEIIKEIPKLDCGESGSTLRFLIPVACALYDRCVFTGRGRLMSRPLEPLIDALKNRGVESNAEGDRLELCGRLKAGRFDISGSVSSQYISGLLFAMPLLHGRSEIVLSSRLSSKGYVDMTVNSMERFGVKIESENGRYFSDGARYISPGKISAQGDWSNAAFWFGAGALGGNINISGLFDGSLQGDKIIANLCGDFGARVSGRYNVSGRELVPADIDAENIPDLVPILSVIACGAKGNTVIRNISRLRLKESDRVESTLALINSLGGKAFVDGDSICVMSDGCLGGGTVDGFNDHRIVMSAAVASCICRRPVIIEGESAVNKSYPHFFEDFKKLGGIADVI